MNKSIEFINRQAELKKIGQIASSQFSQIVYIEGNGGIGKTRLLEKIPEFLRERGISAVCIEIIDFDNLAFQFTDNLIHLLLEYIPSIEKEERESIYQELEALYWMERIGDSRKTQEMQETRIVEELAQVINRVTQTTPLVFRFDTVEKMPLNIRVSIVSLATLLTQAHIVLSGRPESKESKWTQIFDESLFNRHKIELLPFDEDASKEYLEKKENHRNVRLSARDSKKLLELSRGRPIIIDLAVEYFAKSPEFKIKKDTGILAMPAEESDQVFFEKQIVQHVMSVRGKTEQLILVLSRIYPLTQDMLSQILHLSREQAQELFDHAQSEAFVKTIKGQDGIVRISLHDEMRRLVMEHVWDELDPQHYRRQRDSRIAKEIFQAEDNNLRTKKRELQQQSTALTHKKDKETYIRVMVLRRQREIATEEWLKHALYADFKTGFQEWRTVVEKARGEGRKYSFVFRLCELARPYFQQDRTVQIPPDVKLTEQEEYDYQFTYARANQDLGDHLLAEDLYHQLLAKNSQSNARQRQIFNMLGVLKRDQGLLEQAINYQKECRRLLESDNYWAIANVENQLGYLYRLHKDIEPTSRRKAQDHYESALDAARAYNKQVLDSSRKNQNRSLIASVKNNLGYLFGLRQEYENAELYCKQAIDIWEKLDRTREIAWAKINLGVLARDQRQYQQSEQRLQEAISLLTPPDDFRELSQAYLQLGWTQWFMGAINSEKGKRVALLDEARVSLETGLKFATEHDYRWEQPDLYHQLASVYWYLGCEIDSDEYQSKARLYNKTAIKLSLELQNNRYAVDSIVGEMEFDCDAGIDDNIEDHLRQLEPYRKYDFPLYFGRVHRILGDWAYRKGDFFKAFSAYSLAMPLINRHGGYGPYMIEIELGKLAKKLERLPLEQAISFLNLMEGIWSQQMTDGHVNLLFWVEEQVEQIDLLKEGN